MYSSVNEMVCTVRFTLYSLLPFFYFLISRILEPKSSLETLIEIGDT
jgi:hypothetical protein